MTDTRTLDVEGVANVIDIWNMSLAELKQYVKQRHENWPAMWIAAAQSRTATSQKEWLRSIALKIATEPPPAPTHPVPAIPLAYAQPVSPAQPIPAVPLAYALPVSPAQPIPAVPLAYALPVQPQPAEVQPQLPQPQPSAIVTRVFRHGHWWWPSSLPPSPPVTPDVKAYVGLMSRSQLLRCSLLVCAVAVAAAIWPKVNDGTLWVRNSTAVAIALLATAAIFPQLPPLSLGVWARVVPSLFAAAVLMQLQSADVHTVRTLHDDFVSSRVTFTRTLVLSVFGCLWAYAPLHGRRLEWSFLLGFGGLIGTNCAVVLSHGPPDGVTNRTIVVAVASGIVPFPAMYVLLSHWLRGRPAGRHGAYSALPGGFHSPK